LRIFLSAFFFLFSVKAFAQNDSLLQKLTVSGYFETYYVYDFSRPSDHLLPPFIYSFNRHNEFNLNLGLIKAEFKNKNFKSSFGLMAGTYANANLSHEPGVFKNLFEAWAGIKISQYHNLWIEAGVFPSHIGFESALGVENPNLTRSILADNSPYYESGITIAYTSRNNKFLVKGLLLNGWQTIHRTPGNNTPAFGHQFTYILKENITLNSSSFIGNVYPDSISKMRYFHNFYLLFNMREKFDFTAGFDVGAEQKKTLSSTYNLWYSPILILSYRLNEKIKIAGRIEYYSDPSGVILVFPNKEGSGIFGYSLNLDYRIYKNVMWRIEGRRFYYSSPLYFNNSLNNQSTFLTATSLIVNF
jgi:hypothetical protein